MIIIILPDLSLCDYFLLGYLKVLVFKRLQTTDKPKDFIHHQMKNFKDNEAREMNHH